MEFKLKVKPKAEKQIEKVPQEYKVRILIAISQLPKNPHSGEKLKGLLKGLYSLHVWPYRILYQIYKQELLIVVIKVGPRGGVYK